ncbi:immunoglobulin-like domain-containing protein [Paenibacillus sp. HB172176]|uniref:immunoglobulin-like domain-containing protein n=1 Tax=Paenibacillus sp. HB172176 TaxID=2493690 RepID=UPI001439802B|nr:immunoglobulin-like domain-containing protein [Paenibacillus sp. HB172176]
MSTYKRTISPWRRGFIIAFMAWFVCVQLLNASSVMAEGASDELEVGVQVDEVYDADVVLAVGQSDQDVTAFEDDLYGALEDRGLDRSRVRIDSVEAQEVNVLQGDFALNLYWPYVGSGNDLDAHLYFEDSSGNDKGHVYYDNQSVDGGSLDTDDLHGGQGEWLTLNFNEVAADVTTIKVEIYGYSVNSSVTASMKLYKSTEACPSPAASTEGCSLLIDSPENVGNHQTVAFGEFQRNGDSWDFHFRDGRVFSGTEVQVVSRDFLEIIREPDWRTSANHYLVNLNDETLDDLDDSTALGEIIPRMESEKLHYIGWGSDTDGAGTGDATSNQAESFIGRNDNRGVFVNRDGQSYEEQIGQIADYIYSKMSAGSDQDLLTLGNSYELNVSPASEKMNTSDSSWPEGKWRVVHDPTAYENDQGTVPYSGFNLDDLEVQFNKVGKYDIYYKNTLVKTLYVHRKPVSLFTVGEDVSGQPTYEDQSYDLDAQSQTNGIAEREWSWKRTTDEEWTQGQPAVFDADTDYVVRLRVRDYQEAWSSSRTRFQSTRETAVKPIADFQLSATQLTWPESEIEVQDLSYDPRNKAIMEHEWKVFKDEEEVYSGIEPLEDFSALGAGEYKLSLRVRNDENLWSEQFSRFVRIAENSAPTLSSVADQSVYSGHQKQVSVQVDDAESTAFGVTVTASSSDPDLIPTSEIIVSGAGGNRIVTLATVPETSGEAVITLTASDGDLTSQTSFTVEVNDLGLEVGNGFVEAEANDGTIAGIQRVNLIGETLAETLDMSHIHVNNLPVGLDFVVTRISGSKLDLQLTGSAVHHNKENSVGHLSVTIDKENMADGAAEVTSNSFGLVFHDPAFLKVDKGVVTESVYGNGQFDDIIEVSLSGGTFTADIDAESVSVAHLPEGLSATVIRLSDTSLEVGFTGTATVTQDVYNASIIVSSAAIIGNSDDLASPTFKINFLGKEPVLIARTQVIYETDANDGSFEESLVFDLENEEFPETVTDYVYATNQWPAGLQIGSLTRNSPTRVTVSITGHASNHAESNSVSDAQITINGVTSTTFSFLFRSPSPTITASPNMLTDAGDGTITESLTVTLANGIFAADLTGGFQLHNLPEGLGFTVERVSDTEARIVFTGQAVKKNEASSYASVTVGALYVIGSEGPITSNPFDLQAPSDAALAQMDLDRLTWDAIRELNIEQTAVTTDLQLMTAGSSGSTITWTSTDISVVSVEGDVTRPVYEDGDKTVTLHAVVANGSATAEKSFVLVVKKLVATDEQSVAEAKTDLTWNMIREENVTQDNVLSDLSLPTSGSYGSAISWTSSDETAVGTDGVVTRPSYLSGDKAVTLTATITKGEATETKTFELTIVKLPISDEESAAEAKTDLTWDTIREENVTQDNVLSELSLPTTGIYGSAISWTSSDETVVGTDGVVTRPELEDGDREVTLTATITKGDVVVTKTFVLTIKAKEFDIQKQLDEAIGALSIGYAEHDSAEHVTQNIELISTGFYDSSVEWSSHREDVISVDGIVQRPQSDTVVRLTARVTKAGYHREKEFFLTVIGASTVNLPQDELDVAIGYAPGDSETSVTKNLFLTKKGNTGSVVSWQSHLPSVVSSTGRVFRPGPDEADVTVTLTATLTDPGNPADTQSRTFTIVVKKLSDQEAVDEAARSLKIDDAATFVEGDNWESVTEGFFLLLTGKYGTAITWESSQPAVIAIEQDETQTTGTVTRQTAEQQVILTATFTRNGKTATKQYLVIVKALGVTKDAVIRQATSRQAKVETRQDGNEQIQNVTILRTEMSDGTKIDTIITDENELYDLTEAIDPNDPDTANREVTITHTDDSADPADEIAVEIPASAIAILAGRNLSLHIVSGGASVSLDEQSVKLLEAQGTDLYFRIVPVQNEEEQQSIRDRAEKQGPALISLAGGKGFKPLGPSRMIETNFHGVDTLIQLPVADFADLIPTESASARDEFLDSLRIYVEHSDGEKSVYTPQRIVYNPGGEPTAIEFTINKFSSFQVVRIQDVKGNVGGGGIIIEDDSKLTGKKLKELQQQQEDIEVATEGGTISLPSKNLDLDRIRSLFGGEEIDEDRIVFELAIEPADKASADAMADADNLGRGEWVGEPMNFSITASYDGEVYDITADGMVQYTVPVPDGMKITTGVLYRDGMIYHQPTYVYVENERYYAHITSFETGMFGLIWNPEQFADVAGLWSMTDVNDMASRIVVNGVDDFHYEPERNITRAEFGAIIVRALGIVSHEDKILAYPDVVSGAWYEDELSVAVENGLVNGYPDGTFRPGNGITRLESMVIVSRAMAIVGLQPSVQASEIEALLQAFTDGASVPQWAESQVKLNLSAGIIQGRDGRLDLDEWITRAETAAVVRRLFIAAGLINP